MLTAACPSPPPQREFPDSSYLCTAYHEVTLCLPPADGHHSGKLRDYVVTVPCSTDFRGRFLSHVVSAPTAAASHSHLRVARSPPRLERETLRPGGPRHHFLYFNVTVFGKLLHLRLQPNRRLVAPGAPVEWHEDFQELFRQPLQQECVYTGGVTGMPGAAVAISNCDGLVRDKTFPPSEHRVPFTALTPYPFPRTWYTVPPPWPYWLPCSARCEVAVVG